jgi:hypothetical protein
MIRTQILVSVGPSKLPLDQVEANSVNFPGTFKDSPKVFLDVFRFGCLRSTGAVNHGIGGRWWYVLPDWPPPDFDYVAALAERGTFRWSFPEKKSIWKISMVSRVRKIFYNSLQFMHIHAGLSNVVHIDFLICWSSI